MNSFTINERFTFLTSMIQMLADNKQASVIITGSGGLGKSYTVTKTLLEAGYQDISEIDDINLDDYPEEKVFRKVSGYSTPKGLYKDLYENRHSNCILVLDDLDAILQNDTCINLLKAALDSYSDRIISWKSSVKTDLPTNFKFQGRVIFISNLNSSKIDQALISRSMAVDLSMSNGEKIERMRYLLDQESFMEDSFMQHKMDALDLIESLMDSIKDLSLRTLIQVTKIRAANPNRDWERLATYVMCG